MMSIRAFVIISCIFAFCLYMDRGAKQAAAQLDSLRRECHDRGGALVNDRLGGVICERNVIQLRDQ